MTVQPNNTENNGETVDDRDKIPTEKEWCDWLHEVFIEDPELLTLREQVLPFTGGYSFSQAFNSDTSTSLPCIDTQTSLELIYQHLRAIGMNLTAEALELDAKCTFQNIEQNFEHTTLRLIASLGVLTKEDPWDILSDPNHHYHPSETIEGYFGSSYTEPPDTIASQFKDPNSEIIWMPRSTPNIYGIHWASLRRLIVFLIENPPRGEDLNIYLFVLLSIARTDHLFLHFETVFYLESKLKSNKQCSKPEKDKIEELKTQIVKTYRMRILELFDHFISFLGLYLGTKTIKLITFFCQNLISQETISPNLKTIAQNILKKIPQLNYGMLDNKPPLEFEEPVIPVPDILFSQALTILDPEPIEVARQITLIAHQYFKAIYPNEIFTALKTQNFSPQTPSIQEFMAFGDTIQSWFIECLSNATSKDHFSEVFEKLLKISQSLFALGNFDSLSRFVHAVAEARKISDNIDVFINEEKCFLRHFNQLSNMCGIEESHGQNNYRNAIDNRYKNGERAVPNLSVELLSIPLNQPPSQNEDGLINIPRRLLRAQKLNILYQFQCRPYNFYEIPQIVKILKRGPTDTKFGRVQRFEKKNLPM